MIEWLFRPCIADYRGNWQEGYLNRCWIILCTICNPITMSIVFVLHIKGVMSIVPSLVLIGIFVFNMIQQVIFEHYWEPPEEAKA